MDSIFRGDLITPAGRRLAWADSLLVDHGVFRLVWSNFAAVVPGRLYRSNHPTPGRLAAFTRRHGLRTLINLRGATANGSDALSREMAARLGLDFVDVAMRSRAAPPRAQVLRLVEVFGTMAEPALVHCKSGADRAGFAAGVFLVLQGGGSAAALAQLSWRFGHMKRSRAGQMDAFFHRYAAEAEGRRPFVDWLREEYDEAALGREFKAGGLSRFINDRVLVRE
jgi:protein tyrosine/serine phosphatase